MTLFHRRSVFAFVLGAALAAAVLVGRNAFATTETINACFKPSNGTLYLLGESSGRQVCQPGDIPINWNTSGVNGQDGVSVRSQALASGDANCPNGGSKFTAANEVVTYACNGSNGVDGQDGQDGADGTDGADGADGASVASEALEPGDDEACPNGGTKFTVANVVSYACNGSDGVDGQDGEDFSGTFTSANGLYKLVVDDAGVRLEGRLSPEQEVPQTKVQITQNGIQIQTGLFSAVTGVTTIGSSIQTTLNSNGLNNSGLIALNANGQINLNGFGCNLLRTNDVAPIVGPVGAPILQSTGTPRVQTSC